LSAFDRVASLELEDEQAIKLRKQKGNHNVAQAKAARSQTKIYSHLMETRILLQRNLQQQVQVQHPLSSLEDTTSTTTTSSVSGAAVAVAQEECDKLLQQLLQARRTLLQWPQQHDDDDDDDNGKNDQTLEVEYSKCQEHWKQVLNKRHLDLRLHSGLAATAGGSQQQQHQQQHQFKVIDSSFWQQVENTVAHEEMRQQQQQQPQQQEPNTAAVLLFDDAKVYQQMLKEFVVSNNSHNNDPTSIHNNDNTNGVVLLPKSKNFAGNKKQVDRRASKGRKIRYVEIPKLVNFCFPVSKNTQHCKANLSEEEWFNSLFGGAWNNNNNSPQQQQGNNQKQKRKHKAPVDDTAIETSGDY
jgi:Apoptosis-antagonizing transcription factor, C-terminal